MKRQSVRGLLALNGALLVALGVATFAPTAGAQQQAPAAARGRGQYTMVEGALAGRSEAAVYILDAGNMEVLALKYDLGRREMLHIGLRDLAADTGRPGPVKPR